MPKCDPVNLCQKELNKAKGKVEYWKKELAKAKGKKLLKCNRCGKKSRIASWTAQRTWYTEDGGYCIGDQRCPGDWSIICPKCDRSEYIGYDERESHQKFIKDNLNNFKEAIWDDPKD